MRPGPRRYRPRNSRPERDASGSGTSSVDGAVVSHPEQSDGMHLEVQVVRRSLSIARVSDEAEDVSGVDHRTVPRERRVRGEVRVVVLVSGAVTEPEAVAADFVPADGEHRAGCDREN